MKKVILFLAGIAPLAPLVALAQNPTQVIGIATGVKSVLNIVIPIMVTLAVIYFIWGVIKYVIATDEEDKKKGKDMMIYGIIGIFVIVAIWGIVFFIGNFLGISTQSGQGPVLPSVPNVY